MVFIELVGGLLGFVLFLLLLTQVVMHFLFST